MIALGCRSARMGMLMRLGRRVAIVVRLSSILALDLTPQHGMEVVFLIGKQEQHLCAHDADADTRVQRRLVSSGQMAIVQLEAVTAVDSDVPLLIINLEVDLGVDAGDLALRAKIYVHAPVLAMRLTGRQPGDIRLGALLVVAFSRVYTTDSNLRVLNEEAPVARSNLGKGRNVLTLIALRL